MNEEGTRSRVVGALLWSMFAAAGLVLVLFTFVAAYGEDESRFLPPSGTQSESPPPIPDYPASPLCVDSLPADAALLERAVDAWASRTGLEAHGAFEDVAAGQMLPSVPGECGVVALVSRTGPFDMGELPTTRCDGAVRITASCPEPGRNGAVPVRARVYSLPTVELASVAASSMPPLVFLTHALVERELAATPYVAGESVTEVQLLPTPARAPATSGAGCVIWMGVADVVNEVTSVTHHLHCGYAPELPVTSDAARRIWLRPYRRAPGAHVERATAPLPSRPIPMRRVTEIVTPDAGRDGT